MKTLPFLFFGGIVNLLVGCAAETPVVDSDEADIGSTKYGWLDAVEVAPLPTIETETRPGFYVPQQSAKATAAFSLSAERRALVLALPQRSPAFDVDHFSASAFSDVGEGNDAIVVCWKGALLWSCDPDPSGRGMSWYDSEYVPTKIAITTLNALTSRGQRGRAKGTADLVWRFAPSE